MNPSIFCQQMKLTAETITHRDRSVLDVVVESSTVEHVVDRPITPIARIIDAHNVLHSNSFASRLLSKFIVDQFVQLTPSFSDRIQFTLPLVSGASLN